MKKPPVFLQAHWSHLIMANFEVPKEILLPHLPPGTELDTFEGKHYVSMVGFLFKKTRILGIPALFHQLFEEVNLRFYVLFKQGDQIKRGTVFISELVPRPLIPLISNSFYQEKYAYLPMRHSFSETEESQTVRYEWKSVSGWNFMEVEAGKKGLLPNKNSFDAFISEHYWGYNIPSKRGLREYGVEHPQWKVYPVNSFNFVIYSKDLYGKEFEPYLMNTPHSVFLAQGSDVLVRSPQIISL